MQPFIYPKPDNEVFFESFCLKVFRDYLKLPHSVKFARRGQRQFGIDIVSISSGRLIGIQCKLKNARACLTVQEVDKAIKLAKTFRPPLNELIIATTADRDPTIQAHAIRINQNHNVAGLFEIAIYAWQDIEEILKQDPDIANDLYPPKDREAKKKAQTLLAESANSITSSTVTPYLVPELPPQGVIGRSTEIADILDLLAVGHDLRNVPPLALRGMGGIGKTTLATMLGREKIVSDFFTDGVLWAELGPRPKIYDLLKSWATSLEINLFPGSDEPECKRKLLSALFNRQMLLIIDDVWDIAAGRHFLVGGQWCRTLITTRESPIAHTLATPERTRQVGLLSPESSLQLLSRLAPDAVTFDRAAAQELCKKLEFLPLGLKLAGHMLGNEYGVPARLKRLLFELLKRADARLNLLQPESRPGLEDETPASLRAILGMSVERLTEQERHRFAMLAVFGAEPTWWTLNAAEAVWACNREEAEETTTHLIQRGLIEARGERYWMHALLHDYAKELEEYLTQ